MNVRRAILASLKLLGRRDSKRLIAIALFQGFAGLLDLVGIAAIGLITAIVAASLTDTQLPSAAESLLSRLGTSSESVIELAPYLVGAAALLLIVKSLVAIWITRRVLRFLSHKQASVSGRLAEAVFSQPLSVITIESSQQNAFVLTGGVNAATIGVLGQSVIALAEIELILVLGVGLLLLDPFVTLFSILFFGVVAVVLQVSMAGRAERIGSELSRTEIASMELVQETIRSYRELFVLNRRSWFVSKLQALRLQSATVLGEVTFLSSIPKYVFEIALIIGACLLAGSQVMFKSAPAALSTMVLFLAAGSRIVPSMLRLQGAAFTLRTQAGLAAPTYQLAERLSLTAMSRQPSIAETSDHTETPDVEHNSTSTFNASLKVEHVSYRYAQQNTWAIRDVSFSLSRGSSLALVGPSGAGKSTLTDLILGILEPPRGRISIGGVSPSIAIQRWPGCIAYVPQEVALGNGTIRSNVCFGVSPSSLDDEAVWMALRRAHIDVFVSSLPHQLDSVVGENGAKLSGGQRQRLGIARALYSQPTLLILDEATSALDAETEQAVMDTISGLEGEVTTIIIAHRLATVKHATQVLYLEDGEAKAIGSFSEVRSSNPRFDQQASLLGL